MITETLSQQIKTAYPFFDDELIELIVSNSKIKVFEEHEQIMRVGNYIKSTLLILKGKIKVLTDGDDGEEFFMYYIEPGEACALSFFCMLTNEQSRIMAHAVEETEAVLIPIELSETLMTKSKSWNRFVLETYRNRFTELLDVLKNVAFKGMDERLEFYLQKQQAAFHDNHINLTHEQIANDINTSRVVVSRLLKAMEHQGKVKLHRNSVELL